MFLLSLIVPAPVSAATITVAYSSTAVADSALDGDPATGAWSDAASASIPLENQGNAPYGTATLYAKHDGTYVYFRVDGKVDVPWASAAGNHFWFDIVFNPVLVTGHHQGGQDGALFGDSAYTPTPTYPPTPVDTTGNGKPPAKDTVQSLFGRMAYTGSAAPYSFTAEWKRKLSTGDAQDVTFVADGTSSYPFYATVDSDGGGSSGGNLNHKATSNDNAMTFASATDTQAPTVSITAPANGASVTGTVSIAAIASDNVGVTRVEFYADAGLLGTDTTAPYSYSWDTTAASEGSHSLTAKAYDAALNVGTSAAVSVTVDRTPPTAAITAPAADSILAGTVPITASASDLVGVTKVEFYADGNLLGTDLTQPYSYSWDTTSSADGSHSLTAKAYDAALNVGTSAAVPVTLDNTLPTVSITTPVDGSSVKGTISIEALAADNLAVARVDFLVDASPLSSDASAPYQASWDTSVSSEGSHAVQAKAFDTAGNSRTASVTVIVDRTPPIADAGVPLSIPPGTTVALDGTGSTDNVAVVNWTWTFNDGGPKTLWEPSPSYRFNNLGSFTITLTVADAAANTDTGLTWVNVTADTAPPVADAGAPQAVLQGTLVTLDGSGSMDDVGIANYTWVFTDVSAVTLYGRTPTYRFLHVADIQIQLVVRDYVGGTDAAMTWVNVTADSVLPIARAGPDLSVAKGSTVTLDGSASTDNVGITEYTWTFDDPGLVTLSGAVQTYRFSNVANILVTLTVRDYAGGVGTDTAWVNVTPDRTAPSARPGPGQTIGIGQWAELNGSASTDDIGIVNYTWTFVDPTAVTLYGAVVSHHFLSPGNRTVSLTVRDEAGNPATNGTWVDVLGSPAVAVAGPDVTIALGESVTLDASLSTNSTGNGPIANYTWRLLGTAVVLYGENVSYTPTDGGVLTFQLSIVDSAGVPATDEILVTVVAPDRTPPAVPAGLVVTTAGPGTVTLAWSANSDADLAGYLVLRSESPDGPFIQLNLVPITNLTYTDSGLQPGHSYYYVVRAVDLSGNPSAPSTSASASAGPLPPEPFDWASIRWAAAPGLAGFVLVFLSILAWRETRHEKRPASPPKEGSP